MIPAARRISGRWRNDSVSCMGAAPSDQLHSRLCETWRKILFGQQSEAMPSRSVLEPAPSSWSVNLDERPKLTAQSLQPLEGLMRR